MLDYETGEVLKHFESLKAAATWLVENNIAKNTNCTSSIGAVCSKKESPTGRGYRKKHMDISGSLVQMTKRRVNRVF